MGTIDDADGCTEHDIAIPQSIEILRTVRIPLVNESELMKVR